MPLYVIRYRLDGVPAPVYVPGLWDRGKWADTPPATDPAHARKFNLLADAYGHLDSWPLGPLARDVEIVPYLADPAPGSPPAPARAPAPVCPSCGWDTLAAGHDPACDFAAAVASPEAFLASGCPVPVARDYSNGHFGSTD